MYHIEGICCSCGHLIIGKKSDINFKDRMNRCINKKCKESKQWHYYVHGEYYVYYNHKELNAIIKKYIMDKI